MSLDTVSHPDENQIFPRSCPYLGISNDFTTRYGYPNTRNYCHRARPPQPVALEQQSGVCLGGSGAYLNCPVNTDAWQGPLPVELAGEAPYQSVRLRWPYYAAAGLGFVILMAAFIIFNPFRPPVHVPSVGMLTPALYLFDTASPTAEMMASATENAAMVATSSTPLSRPTGLSTIPAAATTTTLPPTVTHALTPTSTATPKPPTPPTQTPKPTSLIPTMGPGLETPLGPKGEYIVHQFIEGETLDGLAFKYRTTIDVIRAINQPKNQSVIWVDTPLVVVVGEVNVKNVRSLQAIWLDTDTRLSYLAEKYGMPIAELLQLNSLGAGDTARSQRWMVVWRK